MNTGSRNISFIGMESSIFNHLHVLNGVSKMASQGSVLSAHNICYKVEVPTKFCFRSQEKEILFNVTTVFKQGLTAIMGPTGSGKSTFLDILAGRKDPSGISGQLLLDGKPVPANYKCMVGYVVQDDTIMGTLSIRENLHFSAALRLPTSVSADERDERVINVIKELGLDKCADTRIGTALSRGVSGGERKRCNIGMELIISPRVLFLDEPTTGLDANTAHNVLMFLKRLSRKGQTIIFSIHQPRYSIFTLFDNLLLLSGGHVVYSGPSYEAMDFFSSQGFRCQVYNNPPDFFLDVINELENEVSKRIDAGKEVYTTDSVSQNHRLIEGFRRSTWYRRLPEEANSILYRFEKQGGLKGARSEPIQYATPFFHQVRLVAGRATRNIIRNPHATITSIGSCTMLAALITAIFWQLDEDPVSAFKDRSGVLFFLIINQLFFNMAAVDVFIKERTIFIHENLCGYYRVSVYFLVKIIIDILPMRTILVVIMSGITYYSMGLNPGVDNLCRFMFSLLCVSLATAGLCLLISSSVREFATAQVLLALFCIFMMLFGGFLVNFGSIGPWLNWAQYLSFFKYALAALYINEFKDHIFCNSNATICETGNNFLQNQQIYYTESWDFWQNHVALLCYACGLLALTYIQLRRMKTLLKR